MASSTSVFDARSQSLATGVPSLLSTLKQTQTYDYLRAAANPDLTKLLYACSRKDVVPSLTSPPTESIQFADDVIKINRKQKRQDRVLVLTNKALYNFAPGSFKNAKRRILIRDLRGVILSRCSDELVFQVSDSYDYRYEIKRRSEVLEMLSKAFEKETEDRDGTPAVLMVSFSEEKELKDMVITKDKLKDLQQISAALALRNPNMSGVEPVSVDAFERERAESQRRGELYSPSSALSTSHSASSSAANQANSPSHSQHSTHQLAPNSPSAAAMASSPTSASSGGAVAPSTPQSKMMLKGSVRQSLITHGASLLSPHILAKIQHQQSGNFPLLAKNSHSQAGGMGVGSGQYGAAHPHSPAGALGGPMNYHAHKHASVIMTGGHGGLMSSNLGTSAPSMMSGMYPASGAGMNAYAANRANRSASKAIAKHPSSSNLSLDDSSDSSSSHSSSSNSEHPSNLHAFRDPNSRLEGWLTKQKGSKSKWDRKYFILTNRNLQYYSPRIKSNVKLKVPVAASRFNSDISLTAGSTSGSSNSKKDGSAMFTDDTPLIMLRIESSTHLVKKDALILAFASEEDASIWSEAFLNRNNDFPPAEIDQYIHLEGWLLKKEKNNKWVRRYVVLTQDRVWFFEMALKGSVEFTKGASAHSSNIIQPTEEIQSNNFAGRYALTRFAYRWNVSDSVRIFYLAADSAEDMDMWIQAIDNVNREHGKAGGNLPSLEEDTHAAAAATAAANSSSQIKLPDEFIESVEQPAPEGQVTFVFTDVQNSTNLWEKVPDAMDQALEQHDRILRELLKKYGGYEVKTEGDAFMVTFFTAIDAILWCLAVQVALVEAEWSEEFCSMPAARKETLADPADPSGAPVTVFNGIRIRMGIHTGFPNCRRNPVTGRMDYYGQPVNRSARVSDTGHGGQIVCTQEVIDQLDLHEKKQSVTPTDLRLRDPDLVPLIQDMGCHALKGINEAVRIYQLMPTKLKLRTLPPIRTSTNEKLEKEKESKAKAAAAASATPPPAAASPAVTSSPASAPAVSAATPSPSPSPSPATSSASPTPVSASSAAPIVQLHLSISHPKPSADPRPSDSSE